MARSAAVSSTSRTFPLDTLTGLPDFTSYRARDDQQRRHRQRRRCGRWQRGLPGAAAAITSRPTVRARWASGLDGLRAALQASRAARGQHGEVQAGPTQEGGIAQPHFLELPRRWPRRDGPARLFPLLRARASWWSGAG